MRVFWIFLCTILPALGAAQGVGVNKNGTPPDPSAMLDVRADSAGILIPRTDTSSIISPVSGLLVFDTTVNSFFFYKGNRWVQLVEAGALNYYFRDQDGDGYGDKFMATYAPNQLPGYVPDSTDCDDLDPALSPGEPDICDEIDNDCNPASPDGSGDAQYATPCDGPDADLCQEGVWDCVSGTFTCTDDTGDNLDLCDGADNDCNPSTPDGSHEILYLMDCDGPDADLCEEGQWQCVGGILVCTDDTGDNLEVCDDGVDNDCDPSTPDGSDDPMYLMPCDGPDADLCEEGQWECSGSMLVCSDNTGDNAELCDGQDNDCDPSTPDGAHEAVYGMPCDGPDSDQCEEGVWECSGGMLVCTDNTSDDVEVCDGVDNDCDGQTDEGSLCPAYNACSSGECAPCCSNNGGTSCAMSTVLGTICGDQGNDEIVQTGCDEAWYRFTLEECNSDWVDLQVTLVLNVPVGMDYDLYLYADNCSTLLGSSSSGGSASETIQFDISDPFPNGNDDTTPFRVRVDLFSGNGSCAPWTLTIYGNQ